MAQDTALAETVSWNDHLIRVTSRQWAHIVEAHDYMAGNLDKVLETLADPDSLAEGEAGATLALRLYAETNIPRKAVVVVYRDEADGFVITSFMTSRPDRIARRRAVTWTRQ